MFKQFGDVEIDLEPPDQRDVGGRARDNFPDGIFARLPDAVALDETLVADGLVYVAARLTWADQKGAFRASDALMKQMGMGRERARKARSAAKACGYLLRYQPHNPARGERAAVAIEQLMLPRIEGEHGYRLVWRSWFDPTRRDITSRSSLPPVDRIKAIAAILFINAIGRPVFARELAKRFGWSRPTAAAVLTALGYAGVVERHERRDERGRISSVRYSTVKKLGDGFLGNGNVGDIRSDSLDEASSKQSSYERYSSQREAKALDRSSDDDELCGMITELRARDLNGVIAARLWRDRSGFTELVRGFGACAVTQVIKARLVEAVIDGRASGSIRSLGYFCGALEDDKIRRDMERRGERPGDVWGAHRRCSESRRLSLITERHQRNHGDTHDQ
jgi:hypothetical protein